VSSFWAGQQGSLLLWALLAALIGVALPKRQPVLMSFWASVLAFMSVLLLVADPFAKLPNYHAGVVGSA